MAKKNGVNPAIEQAIRTELPASPVGAMILPTHLVIENQKKSLYKAREKKVVEAICRLTGRTDYETTTMENLAIQVCEVEEQFYKRGTWHDTDKGELVFRWDGKDVLLFSPIVEISGQLVQRCEELYDKRALRKTHHTAEDERG